MIVVFLVLMLIMLACFGLIIWLLFLGIQKDTIDLDFQTIWQDVKVTRKDMEFE
jgi:hypothetical protein